MENSSNNFNSFFLDCFIGEVRFFKEKLGCLENIKEEEKKIEKFLANYSLDIHKFPNDEEVLFILRNNIIQKWSFHYDSFIKIYKI